ncbi:MAG TPA: bacteriocin [Rhodothermales bacterium]
MKSKKSSEQEVPVPNEDERVDVPLTDEEKPASVPISDDELEQITGGLNTNWHFDW